MLTGETQSELSVKARSLVVTLDSEFARAHLRLQDVAYSLATARQPIGDKQPALTLAIVASSFDDLLAKLTRGRGPSGRLGMRADPGDDGHLLRLKAAGSKGKVAFLFPGEGSPYVNMLAGLCAAFPEVREVFDQGDRLARANGDSFLPSDYIFPKNTFSKEDRDRVAEHLGSLKGAVVANLIADMAIHHVMRGLCVKPDAMVGHSSGENAALLAAGVFGDSINNMTDALLQTEASTELDARIEPAVMIALAAGRQEVEALISENGLAAEVAIDNCPHQVIVILAPEAEAGLMTAALGRGILAERLPVDRPCHTPGFSAYSEKQRSILATVELGPPQVSVYSCMTTRPFDTDVKVIADMMAEQWSRPVEFRKTIERMYEDGIRLFVEVGARNNLTAFVDDCLRGKEFCAVASNMAQRSDTTQINHMAGLLMAHGVPVRIEFLYEHRDPRLIDLAAPAMSESADSASSEVELKMAAPDMRLPAGFRFSSHMGTSAALPALELRERINGREPVDHQEGFMANDKDVAAEVQNTDHNGSSPVSPNAGWTEMPASNIDANTLSGIAHGFLQTMDHFLDVQNQVMQSYLEAVRGNGTGEAPYVPSTRPAVEAWGSNGNAARQLQAPLTELPASEALVVSAPVSENGATAAMYADFSPKAVPPVGSAAEPGETAPQDLEAVLPGLLQSIVSDRTGYPLEIIDLNADLEADLGIDSIKRVEILGTLRQLMPGLNEINLELLTPLRTLRQIIDVMLAELSNPIAEVADHAGDSGSGVFEPSEIQAAPQLWGKVIDFRPGQEIVVRQVFDPAADGWLRDHVFGREVSQSDGNLLGLPVLPMAMSVELMAQAAAALKPGNVAVRIEKIRANRWVEFGASPQTIEVRARLASKDQSRVLVELRNLDEDGSASSMGPAAEATVLFAPSFQEAPPPLSLVSADGPSTLDPESYYDEVLFHGPSWQALREIESSGTGGSRSAISVPGPEPFSRLTSTSWALDPVVLDAGGQALGCWTFESLTEDVSILPVGVEAIDLFAPPPSPGSLVACLLKVDDVKPQTVRADFDVVTGDRVWMQVRGWTSRRFRIPPQLTELAKPRSLGTMSASVPLDSLEAGARKTSEARSIEVEVVDSPALLFRLWSLRILSKREREVLLGADGSAEGDFSRLAGMHVAKEAARALLQRQYGYDVWPADIELEAYGESGFLANRSGINPVTVWVAQEGTRSVAFATLDPALIDDPAATLRTLMSRATAGTLGGGRQT